MNEEVAIGERLGQEDAASLALEGRCEARARQEEHGVSAELLGSELAAKVKVAATAETVAEVEKG